MFKIEEYPIIFQEPLRACEPLSWIEHIPCAFLLVELLRPKVFVELGVHTGNSFCAFCQAVNHLCLDTVCYGVDTFRVTARQVFMILQCMKDYLLMLINNMARMPIF